MRIGGLIVQDPDTSGHYMQRAVYPGCEEASSGTQQSAHIALGAGRAPDGQATLFRSSLLSPVCDHP
jgi:hypothetical protein